MNIPKLTKAQHLVAFLIVLPSIPFALPLSAMVLAAEWLHKGCEALYNLVGWPFLTARRAWIIRCERVNAGRATLRALESQP